MSSTSLTSSLLDDETCCYTLCQEISSNVGLEGGRTISSDVKCRFVLILRV